MPGDQSLRASIALLGCFLSCGAALVAWFWSRWAPLPFALLASASFAVGLLDTRAARRQGTSAPADLLLVFLGWCVFCSIVLPLLYR